MLAFVLALAVAPWAHPLAFQPLPGWTTGANGSTESAYVGHRTRAIVPLESTAWIARNVRYRDEPTTDQPNPTLAHLPGNGLIVWAVIYNPANSGAPLRLDLRKAHHLRCCEGAAVRILERDIELHAGSIGGPPHARRQCFLPMRWRYKRGMEA